MSDTSEQTLINPGGETPSPLCDELLKQARDFQDGNLSAEQLGQVVADVSERLRAARDQTLANLGEAGEEHAQAFGPYIQNLQKSFTDMEQALRALSEYGKSGSARELARVEKLLVQAALSNQYAMDAYQRAELEHGPTPMPIMNLLIRLKDGFLAGGVEKDDFLGAVTGAAQMTEQALQELEQAEPPQPQELQGLKDAYSRQRYNLKVLQAAIREGKLRAMEDAMEGVMASSERVRGAIDLLNRAIMATGPCKLERTNIFLNLARAHHQGTIPDQVLADALLGLREELAVERKEVERTLSMPKVSASVQEFLGPTFEAYDMHELPLELFERYLAGESTYEEACEQLIEASALLAECRDAFNEIAETEGKVSCVRCGTPNEPGGKACVKCGAVLPHMPGIDATSTMSYQETDGQAEFAGELEMTENLARLFDAVNAVAENQIGPEEFEEVLVWMDDLLAENLGELPPAPSFKRTDDLSAQDRKQLDEVEADLDLRRSMMREGAEEFRLALGRMQCFLDDGEKDHLVEGVRAVRDAAIKIQQSDRTIEALARQLQAAADRKD